MKNWKFKKRNICGGTDYLKYTGVEIVKIEEQSFWKINFFRIKPGVDLHEAASELVPLISLEEGFDRCLVVLLVTYTKKMIASFKPDREEIIEAKTEM